MPTRCAHINVWCDKAKGHQGLQESREASAAHLLPAQPLTSRSAVSCWEIWQPLEDHSLLERLSHVPPPAAFSNTDCWCHDTWGNGTSGISGKAMLKSLLFCSTANQQKMMNCSGWDSCAKNVFFFGLVRVGKRWRGGSNFYFILFHFFLKERSCKSALAWTINSFLLSDYLKLNLVWKHSFEREGELLCWKR